MTLREFLSNLANAFRTYLDTTDKINAQNFADKVGEVFEAGKAQGGGGDPVEAFLDIYLENGNRQNISYAFSGDCWTAEMLSKIKHVIKPIETKASDRYAQGVFFRLYRNKKELFDMTEICKKFDFSECLTLTSLFHNARVENLTINASKAQGLRQTFAAGDGGNINHVTLTVSEACTDYYQTFYYQSEMTEVRFTDGSVIAASIDFARSNLLTVESAKNILKTLKDFSGTDKEYTCAVTFHADTWALLDAEGDTSPIGTTWAEYVAQKGWNT